MTTRQSQRKRKHRDEEETNETQNDGNNNDSVAPDETVSSSTADENDNNNDGGTMDVLKTLRILHSKTPTPQQMTKAIKFMEDLLALDPPGRTRVSKEFVDLQGLSILLFTLEEQTTQAQRRRKEITRAIISTLCEITCQDDRSCPVIVDLGGVDTILKAAKLYSTDSYISGDVVSILSNMNINEESTDAVIGNDCMDYCLKVMNEFDTDLQIQSNGCRYFNEMTKIDTLISTLNNKQIDKLLLEACHKFRGQQRYRYEHDICKESIDRLTKW